MRTPVLTAVLGLLVLGCDDGAAKMEQVGSSEATGSETGAPMGENGTESTGEPTTLEGEAALVDLALFEKTSAEDDPFDDRPAEVLCAFGFGYEDGFFEFETDVCNYGGFSQPSIAPVRVGDTVNFLLLHENLTSEDPDAQTHVAVAFGEEIVFETTIDIPTEADFIDSAWVSTVDAPEGTPVHVHVHNHGINSYRISELTVSYAE